MAPRNRRKPSAGEGPEPVLRELERLALELDLTALPEALPRLLDQAEQEAWSYTDFARTLLDVEWRARQERKLTRLLKRSHLDKVEGIDGFNFAARPQLQPCIVKELITCRFVEENRNVLCLGAPGLGKTRIGKTLAHAACLRGYSVLFTGTAAMLEDLHSSLADDTFRRAFRRYVKPNVLLLDDFGYEPIQGPHATYLFRVVSARHGHGSIILTASTGFSKWSRFFPSEAQAVATVDRLLDRATVLRFTGKSFRKPDTVTGAPLD